MSPTHVPSTHTLRCVTRPQLRHQLLFDDLETFAVQLGVFAAEFCCAKLIVT